MSNDSMEGFVDVNAGAQQAPERGSDGSEDFSSVEDRAVSLKMRLIEAASAKESAGEGETDSSAEPAPAKPAAPPAPAEKPADGERIKRLEALRAQERSQIDEAMRQKSVADREAKLSELEKRLAEREAKLAHWEKLETGSPDDVLNYITKRVKDPEAISGAIARMTDPDARMEAIAERVRNEAMAEVKALREENERYRREREERAQAEAAAKHAEEASRQFQAFAKENASEAPNAVRLLELAPEDFAERAELIAASYLRRQQPFTFADVLLDLDARAGKLLGSIQQSGTAQSKPASAVGRGSGAAGAGSLPNNLAQERTAVTEESDEEDLSYDERVQRLQRRLKGQPLPRRAGGSQKG